MRLSKHGDYERAVKFHVYGFVVYVVFSDDLAKSVAPRYPAIKVASSYHALCCRTANSPEMHMFFKLGDAPAGAIAHESWHAVRYILDDWTGGCLDNEVVAYHLGYLVDVVTGFKNKLIDNGIGVKSSSKKEARRENNSQRSTSRMPRVQSRFGKKSR